MYICIIYKSYYLYCIQIFSLLSDETDKAQGILASTTDCVLLQTLSLNAFK